MQREQGSEPRRDGERRHDPDGPVIVGVSSQTPGLRQVLEFAADEANRRRVDLTLVHGCSPIPMPTTLEPTTPLKDREVQWIKRLGMMAEMAAELLDPGRTVDIIVDRGTGVHALLEASASASMVVVQRRRIARGRRIRTGSTSALVAVGSRAPVAVLSASEASLAPSANVVVGVDTSSASSALSVAFREAELRQTGLLVVHGWRPKRSRLFADRSVEEDEYRRQFRLAHLTLAEYVRPWASQYPQVPAPPQAIYIATGRELAAGRIRRSVTGSRAAPARPPRHRRSRPGRPSVSGRGVRSGSDHLREPTGRTARRSRVLSAVS